MAGKSGLLAGLDLSLKLTPDQEAARLAAAQDRLLQLRLVLGGQIGDNPQLGPPVCVVFEGWDASGKGGAIKRLVAPLDPRHVRVAQFGAPSYDEKRHHFLWRFWPVLPGWGGMAVLDRSWYGRVLVERVEGFATEKQWRRAYREITEFERTLAEEGMIMVKFWLHLSSGNSSAVQGTAARPAEDLEADGGRLAESREAAAVQGGRGGDAGPDRPPSRTMGAGRGRGQAVGQGQGSRVGGRGHRSRPGRTEPAGSAGAPGSIGLIAVQRAGALPVARLGAGLWGNPD